LQVVNDKVSTTFGAEDSSVFHFNTGLSGFYFNKEITVYGDIHSYNTDTILGPSDNTDTYLKVYNDSSDKITAQADEFLVQGDSKYLQMKFTSTAAELRTDADSIYMNKPLKVDGNISVSGSLLMGGRGLRKVTSELGTVQTVGGGVGGWDGYSIGGRYAFISSDNNQVGIYNDVDDKWVTFYEKTAVSGGRYRVWVNGLQVLGLQHTNGNGVASYDGDNNWDFYSDRRLKEDIVKEDNLLDRIMSLDVVNYRFIGEKKRQHKELGLIAQEVEPLFPSLVSEQDDDRYEFKVKSLGYNSFGVIAVGGIKELKLQTDAAVDSLRSENKALKDELAELKGEMELVKSRLANNSTSESRLAELEAMMAKLGGGE
jgi:hypothetical protein